MKIRTMVMTSALVAACVLLIGGVMKAQENQTTGSTAAVAAPAPAATPANPPTLVAEQPPTFETNVANPTLVAEQPPTVATPTPVGEQPPAVTSPTPVGEQPPSAGIAPATEPKPAVEAEAKPLAVEPAPAPEAGQAKTNAEVKAGDMETATFVPDQAEIHGAKAVTNTVNENLISIMLDDVEMADVVRMFTRISGANIIASPSNLQGRVTVNLTDVEWKPALMSILDMHQLDLVEKTPGSGVFSIVPKMPGQPPPMSVETIFLKYASVSNVLPVIKAMVAEQRGMVSDFPSKNALVVKTTQSNLSEVKQIIASIDKLRDQVFIETKFLELSDDAVENLGINWQSLQGYNVTASSLQYSYKDQDTWDKTRTDKSGTFDNRARNDALLKYSDMHGQRFEQSQVTYVESPPGSGNYTATANITPTRTVNDTIDKGKSISSDLSDQFTKSVTDMKSAILSAADFQATLAALKQVNGVSIVSDPKIIVANEQTALIHIGDRRRPFVSSVTPGQQGIAPVVSYNPGEPVDTGVKLMVTPTINTSSNITVKIEPELTSLTGVDTAPNGQTYPIISTKKITTVFCLESGKTVAIGGLTQNTEKKSSSKVPLLGDIPLIGKYLFSWSSTEKDQDETIIFVTVCLATPESIQKEDGLPEDTELARKQLIMAALKKQQLDAQMKELKENASSEADSAKAMKIKDRLLRRTD